MGREDKPVLYVNIHRGLLVSQILEREKRYVITSAYGNKANHVLIAMELGRRCLSAGIFELSFNGLYRGTTIKFVNNLKHIGIVI